MSNSNTILIVLDYVFGIKMCHLLELIGKGSVKEIGSKKYQLEEKQNSFLNLSKKVWNLRPQFRHFSLKVLVYTYVWKNILSLASTSEKDLLDFSGLQRLLLRWLNEFCFLWFLLFFIDAIFDVLLNLCKTVAIAFVV